MCLILGGFEGRSAASENERNADRDAACDLQPGQLFGQQRHGEKRGEERLEVRYERCA